VVTIWILIQPAAELNSGGQMAEKNETLRKREGSIEKLTPNSYPSSTFQQALSAVIFVDDVPLQRRVAVRRVQ